MKNLKDMSLEELWELFPIVLSPHKREWSVYAEDEIKFRSGLLSDYTPTINHIGSTAIPDIQAKPIVDILVEIAPQTEWAYLRSMMEANGYMCMSVSDNRMSFNKGYTVAGYADKVFHIHFHLPGDNDEIYFRDYLISHPHTAKDYEQLKLSLLPEYRHNRDGYTEAKTEFVRNMVNIARKAEATQP